MNSFKSHTIKHNRKCTEELCSAVSNGTHPQSDERKVLTVTGEGWVTGVPAQRRGGAHDGLTCFLLTAPL